MNNVNNDWLKIGGSFFKNVKQFFNESTLRDGFVYKAGMVTYFFLT